MGAGGVEEVSVWGVENLPGGWDEVTPLYYGGDYGTAGNTIPPVVPRIHAPPRWTKIHIVRVTDKTAQRDRTVYINLLLAVSSSYHGPGTRHPSTHPSIYHLHASSPC